jgi:hypothetical protein
MRLPYAAQDIEQQPLGAAELRGRIEIDDVQDAFSR